MHWTSFPNGRAWDAYRKGGFLMDWLMSWLAFSLSVFVAARILPAVHIRSLGAAIGVAAVYGVLKFLFYWVLVPAVPAFYHRNAGALPRRNQCHLALDYGQANRGFRDRQLPAYHHCFAGHLVL